MKILITGSRSIKDEKLIGEILKFWLDTSDISLNSETLLIHGGAIGVDTIAGDWFKTRFVKTRICQPDYARYGRYQAPKVRNVKMVRMLDKDTDRVLAIWDGQSSGTFHCMGQSRLAGIPTDLVVIGSLSGPLAKCLSDLGGVTWLEVENERRPMGCPVQVPLIELKKRSLLRALPLGGSQA